MSNQGDIAKLLLRLGCVQINFDRPFLYASGLKGPIYCDNRKVLSYPTERDRIIASFIGLINEHGLNFDHIAGIATSGIPFGAMIADRMKKSFIYIRVEGKGHGKRRQVEGDFNEGDNILLIEDLVNQGSSLEKVCDASKKMNLNIVGALSIVDYQMEEAKERLERLGVSLFSLTNFSNLAEISLKENLISADNFSFLKNWNKDPKNWTKEK